MNERAHFFIKISISHTLFSMFLWCVRDAWRQGQTAILTQLLFLTISRCVYLQEPTVLLRFLARIAQPGVAEGHTSHGRSQSASWYSVCLWPADSTATGIYLYSFITPTYFRFFFRLFTRVHLWLTVRSRVNIQHFFQRLDNSTSHLPDFETTQGGSWNTNNKVSGIFSVTTCLTFFIFLWIRRHLFILSLSPLTFLETQQRHIQLIS